MATANLVQWILTTSTLYANMVDKNPNALYFLQDTGELFRGNVSFSESVKFYDVLPEKGAQGKIYMDNVTLSGKVWNGNAWVDVIKPIKQTLDPKSLDPVSAKAVADYIDTNGTGGVAKDAITDITFDSETEALQITKNGEISNVSLDTFLGESKISWAPDAGDNYGILTFIKNGVPLNINVPNTMKDKFVESGKYNSATKELEITMNEGTVVKIPVADLLSSYTAGSSNTTTTSITEGVISTAVKISTLPGNVLKAQSDGLSVILDKVVDGETQVDQIIIGKSDGGIKASGYKLGGATLADEPSDKVLATEAAVNAIKSLIISGLTSADIVTETLNLELPSTSKVVSEKALVNTLSWKIISE